MANESEVKILITAVDKASNAMTGIDKSITGLNKTTTTSNSVFGKFESQMKMAIIPAIGIGLAVGKLTRYISASIAETVQYAKEVRDLSRALGINAEQTSRLIELADDYMINVGELQNALKFAVKSGFAPTIDSLAELADKYIAIQSPTERAAMLTKIFGRNWAVLTPLLEDGGDALRDNAAAISDLLIMDDAAIRQARAYEIANDKLKDSFTGIKRVVAEETIPIISAYTEAIADSITSSEGLIQSNKKFFSGILSGTSGALTKYVLGLGSLAYVLAEVREEEGKLAASEQIVYKWMAKALGITKDTDKALGNLGDEVEDTGDAAKDATRAWDGFISKYDEMATRTNYGIVAIGKIRKAIAELEKEKFDAELNLELTIKDVSRSLGDQINSAIKAAELKPRLETAALSVSDVIFGTDAIRQQNLQKAIDDALADLKVTGDIGAYSKAMQAIWDWIVPTDETVKEAEAQLKIIEDNIKKLQDMPKRYDIYVYTWWIDKGAPSGAGNANRSGERHGGPQEQSFGGNTGLTINGGINVTAAPDMNERRVAQLTVLALTRVARVGRNNGIWSTGRL